MEFAIKVSNPSPYPRTDYVQIDLNKLGVPNHLEEKDLTLYRIINNNKKEPIPFQIDSVLGEHCFDVNKQAAARILVFSSNDTPSGDEHYTHPSSEFLLVAEETFPFEPPPELVLKYFYQAPEPNEKDGSLIWDEKRPLDGVKLCNSELKMYFKLNAIYSPQGVSYAGSATDIFVRRVWEKNRCDNILFPLSFGVGEKTEEKWGKLEKLVFFPAPWEHRWFQEKRIDDIGYDLIYAKNGSTRAVITLRSKPIKLHYEGETIFEHGSTDINVHLYRLIYIYGHQDSAYYTEELFVLTDKGASISFRPYYSSTLYFPPEEYNHFQLYKQDHVPDYFSIWSQMSFIAYGWAFASDAHIRSLEINRDASKVSWRLPNTHHNRCIHYFLIENGTIQKDFDPLDTIGNSWYTKVYKPLEPYPLDLRFFRLHPPEGI